MTIFSKALSAQGIEYKDNFVTIVFSLLRQRVFYQAIKNNLLEKPLYKVLFIMFNEKIVSIFLPPFLSLAQKAKIF